MYLLKKFKIDLERSSSMNGRIYTFHENFSLLSDWNTVGSGQLNPRDNPEYQSKIEYIDFVREIFAFLFIA